MNWAFMQTTISPLLSSPMCNTNSHIIENNKYFWQNNSLHRLKALLPWTSSLGSMGGLGEKNDVRSGAELFLVSLISFHRAPVLKSSQRVLLVWLFCCTMWESGSKISSQLWLSLPYNWVPAAPMDQLIASAVYEIHTGLWQLAL